MHVRLTAALAALSISAATSFAANVTLVDTTAGTAVNDGIVGLPGEYSQSTAGINSGFGDVIGLGSSFAIDSDTAGNVNIGIASAGSFNDAAVIYIDSIGGVGLNSTTTIEDTSDPGRSAISGDGGGNESEITFAPTFFADFAIAIDTGFAGLFQINSDGSLTFVASANRNAADSNNTEIDFNLSNIGLSAGDSFDFVVTYLNSSNAFRSDEFVGVSGTTVPSGNIGQNPVTLLTNDFATFTAIPEPLSVLAGGGLLGLIVLRRR
ncbi:MAG: hypothetical protein AAGD32_11215 [Planctomycetota bacterium]